MMHSIKTFAFIGSQAKKIQVECDISAGLPHFSIVGLPDSSIQESKERVRSALKNSGFKFPAKRITVNLAPTGIRKTGSSFDFPIALALLASEHVWKSEWLEKSIIFGELSLDGNLRSTS